MQFLSAIQPLIQLFIAFFWAIFVIFTIKTFIQIRRQTELQMKAFLLVSAEKISNEKEFGIRYDNRMENLYNKWKVILNSNIPQAQQPEKFISLKLANKGKSTITSWSINVKTIIKPGEFLRDNITAQGEECEWTIISQDAKDAIESDSHITIIVGKTGVFPLVEFRWNLIYTDMRNVSYQDFAGDSNISDENTIALRGKQSNDNVVD